MRSAVHVERSGFGQGWRLLWICLLTVTSASLIRAQAMCGPLPTRNSSRHTFPSSMSKFQLGTSTEYSCDPGYVRSGTTSAATSTCVLEGGKAVWTRTNFTCQPISCGDPGQIDNGGHHSTEYTFGKEVQYYCDRGYQLIGRVQRFCQADGRWSGSLPTCSVVSCPQPDNPASGWVEVTIMTYRSVIYYRCLEGYTLHGPTERTCLEDKEWSGYPPRCEEKTCGHPGNFSTGSVTLLESTRIDDRITYTCNDGREYIAKCQPNGRWEPSAPSCMGERLMITEAPPLPVITTQEFTRPMHFATQEPEVRSSDWSTFVFVVAVVLIVCPVIVSVGFIIYRRTKFNNENYEYPQDQIFERQDSFFRNVTVR